MTDAPDMEAVDDERQLPAVEVMPADTLPSGDEYLISKAFVHEGAIIALYGTNDKLIGWIDTNAWMKGRVYRDQILPLASSPAPTGAEPVAWRWRDGDMRWQATADEDRASYAFRVDGYEVEDLYASPQPVAPTGEIAGLRRMSDAHREHAQSAVEHNATLNRLLSIAEARADRLEAEAADLRRKLEEHQDAEDKAAREMATVIQGLRNRATAAERKLEEAERELDAAKHLAISLSKRLDDADYGFERDTRIHQQSRAEAAERKLEEARKALEERCRDAFIDGYASADGHGTAPWGNSETKADLDRARTLSGASE